VASASGTGRQPSGSHPGHSRATRRSKARSYGGFDCPRRRRRFGTGTRRAISRDNDGSFGPRPRCVLDDVGVRFGGSEHHRIDTSSSHTRPPARKGREFRPPGAGQPALFIASRVRSLASCNRRSSEPRALDSTRYNTRPPRRPGGVPSGYDRRSSSEPRAPRLTGGRKPAPLGVPGAVLHRDRNPELFGASGAHPVGTRQWSSSEPRAPGSTRDRETAPLRRSGIHVSTRPESPARGVGPPGQPGATGRSSSERRAARLVGTGQVELFGASPARFHGSGNLQLFGAVGTPAHLGPGNRSSSEPRAPSLIEVRQTALFGGPRAEPHRGQADGTLRRAASRASPGPGQQRSSERRQPVPPWSGKPHFTGTGQSELLGASSARLNGMSPSPLRGRVSVLLGAPPPASRDPATGTLRSVERQEPNRAPRSSERGALGVRQPEFFGTPRAELHRGQAIGVLRNPARRAPRGNATGALRRPARGASSGPGQQRSSERGQPVPPGQGHRPLRRNGNLVSTGAGNPISPEHGRRHSSERRALRLDRVCRHRSSSERRVQLPTGTGSRALRSPGAPSHRDRTLISSGNRSPAPLGARAGRRPAGKGCCGCTLPTSVGSGRQGHRLTSAPTPGRTVTAGRQRPQ
jgi:hypothetical protein